MKKFKLALGVLCASLLFSGSAFALVISTPIDYDTDNLVGTADPGTDSSNEANRLIWANQILALDAGTTTTIGGVDYKTHNTDNYSGVLTLAGFLSGTGNSIAAGFQYVLAKYNGKNAGYVLFYLGGQAATIPQDSNAIWLNPGQNGYGLSSWTAFGPVTTTVPAPGTLFILAMGLLLIGFARHGIARRRSTAAA